MIQDPFYKRESKKYTNPVPSREFILSFFNKNKKFINKKELLINLGIKGLKQNKIIKKRLRAMERDCQIISFKKKYYTLPEHITLIKGIVIGHRDGYGFLKSITLKNDLWISSRQMKLCIHGDIVLAKIYQTKKTQKQEARILKVLNLKNRKIVGKFFCNDKNYNFVIPNDNRFNFKILIFDKFNLDKLNESVVVVELIKRPSNFSNKAVGKIIEILGKKITTSLALKIALRTYEIPYKWPKKIKNKICKIKGSISQNILKNRVDLRSLPFITIDNDDAHDFDDAIFCKEISGIGWNLWVAISDVSYYVKPGTLLDIEAKKRGTSIYFPFQVIPMLPEKLSNDICSLKPNLERLCLICEIKLSSSGEIINYKHYEAVIVSHGRLTYEEVYNIWKGNKKIINKYKKNIIDFVNKLSFFYSVLEISQKNRGSINFENPEPKFILDEQHNIKYIYCAKRNNSHRLIEYCMILANISSADFILKYSEPSLFRDHDKPNTNNVINFRYLLNKFGLTLKGGKNPSSLNYSLLLNNLEKHSCKEIIQINLLRSMKQAVYDSENRGHFGLSLPHYAHFTSPIRRYPDLLLHRSIKYLIKKKKLFHCKFNNLSSGGHHYSITDMKKLGVLCSMTERRADEVTKNVIDWLKCNFMKSKIGKIFNAIIFNITSLGIFIKLNNLFIDSFICVNSINNQIFYLDILNQQLIHKFSKKVFCLGDTIKVKIIDVNLYKHKINCSFVYFN
ncbi:ribonuclease R [Buchnera aphidicola (Neophyllaphis podocarpi)]|uniref:ribonuclease R n=1 Tax=Buchnera aphidicola TaxID=9 RepID=UPI0031B89D10